MKTITLAITITLLMLVFTSHAPGGVFNKPGMEVSIGGVDTVAPGTRDTNYDFNWGSVSVFNRYDLNDNWNINLHGTLGYLWWTATNNNGSNEQTFSVGAELILYRKLYKNLSLGLGGGFSTLSQNDNVPDLGDSGLYGTITGRLNLKVNKNYGLEFAADHISDALQDDDAGKNVLALKVYYMFN